MSVEIIQNSRDSLGRFQEKKTPRAKRVEIWLEPQLITRVDSLCELLKVGRGRIIQRLMERLLPSENQPADHLSPGSSITRLDYQGNESNSMVLARQGHLLLTSGPEPWLEWEIIQGWNWQLDALTGLAGPSLEDFVAIAEPALLSTGFDLEDQQKLVTQPLQVGKPQATRTRRRHRGAALARLFHSLRGCQTL